MNNDRDSQYFGYGYGMGYNPNMMPNNNMPFMNNNIPSGNNYMSNWSQDINNRIDKLLD